MKRILLLITFFTSIQFFGQGATTCATATTITTNGTYVIGALSTGTYPTGTGLCFASGSTTPNARWYKFTPATSGLITISSDIAANSAVADTRLSILTGTCTGPWTCIAANDDVNEATSNFRSTVTNVTVNAGTTYYIVWDDRWDSGNYSFTFNYVEQSCFVPTGFTFIGTPTTTTASIGWTAPANGTPTGYQFEYGLRGFTQGTGTVVSTTLPNVSLTNLTASSVYSFYVRTNCGTNGFSVWAGPISFNTIFEPANLPYTTSFEDTSVAFIGWSAPAPAAGAGSAWQLNASGAGALVQDGATSFLSISSSTAVSNVSTISRGFNLVGGQPVTVSFYVSNYRATGNTTSTSSYEVRYGNAQTVVGQTNLITTESNYASAPFTLKTYSFTPAVSGVYFLSIKNISPQNTSNPSALHAVIIDNFTVTQVLSNSEFELKNIAIYPNPTSNLLNINSGTDASISAIQILDLNGRQMFTRTFNNVSDAQINVNDLSAGMYLINITAGDQTVTKKFLKQ